MATIDVSADRPISPGASFRESNENSLFVSDIARGVTDEMLKEQFTKMGKVLEAFVVKNKFTGETKGYGFVRFESMDDVCKCLQSRALPGFQDNITHKFQTVRVTVADPKDTLMIINIPREFSEDDVLKSITQHGGEQPRKFRMSESSRTTAYASYSDHDQALRCMKNIQRPNQGAVPAPFSAQLAPPRHHDARAMSGVATQDRLNNANNRSLFIRGTAGMSSDEVKSLFGGPTEVERVVIPVDSEKGTPLGHAFVHFLTPKQATAAKDKFNGLEHEGRKISTQWCLPKGQVAAGRGRGDPSSLLAHPMMPGMHPMMAAGAMHHRGGGATAASAADLAYGMGYGYGGYAYPYPPYGYDPYYPPPPPADYSDPYHPHRGGYSDPYAYPPPVAYDTRTQRDTREQAGGYSAAGPDRNRSRPHTTGAVGAGRGVGGVDARAPLGGGGGMMGGVVPGGRGEPGYPAAGRGNRYTPY
eukprot:TRINITY_DN7433_c0_g1_i1.p1 TRINITY_DN7433_c0_g1~~TRINITY_DN7433_c0_g1_i1.p1  ORF type:complete len:472 (-),score=150.33 TRINITY_DN7433_c0_g1_i1:38-1453(-)